MPGGFSGQLCSPGRRCSMECCPSQCITPWLMDLFLSTGRKAALCQMSCIALDKGFRSWCIFLVIHQEGRGKPACRHSKRPAMLTASKQMRSTCCVWVQMTFQKRPKSSDISGINSGFLKIYFLLIPNLSVNENNCVISSAAYEWCGSVTLHSTHLAMSNDAFISVFVADLSL